MTAAGRLGAAFTVLEVLICVSVVALLCGILVPSLGEARRRGRDALCPANLRSIGGLIQGFAAAHEEQVAPVVREKDFFWNRGPGQGWDITTGVWASTGGGYGSVWQCRAENRPYVGNARALGLDNRPTLQGGLLHVVGPRLWQDTARLVLAYDARGDQAVYPQGPGSNRFAAIGDDPYLGDVSDEMTQPWVRQGSRTYIPFAPGASGSHAGGGTGVLFADGHAVVGRFADSSTAALWSGPRWWPDKVEMRPYRP